MEFELVGMERNTGGRVLVMNVELPPARLVEDDDVTSAELLSVLSGEELFCDEAAEVLDTSDVSVDEDIVGCSELVTVVIEVAISLRIVVDMATEVEVVVRIEVETNMYTSVAVTTWVDHEVASNTETGPFTAAFSA